MKIIKETFFYYYCRRPRRTPFEPYAASFESYAAFRFPPLNYFYSHGEPGSICVARVSAGQMVDYDVPDMDTAKHLAKTYIFASMSMEDDVPVSLAQSESTDNFYIMMPGKKFAAAIIYKRPISTRHLGGTAGNWYVYRPRGQRLTAEAQRYGPYPSRGKAFEEVKKIFDG